MENINFHIDELHLDGFPFEQRHGIAESMQTELQRLFQERGVPESLRDGGEIASLDAGAFSVHSGGSPAKIGTQAAQAIFAKF